MTHSLASIRSLCFAALVVSTLPSVALAQTPSTDPSGDTTFNSMAIARDQADACRVPKPPIDLAETAYLRNGYRAILRILIAEEALASESCTCLLGDFTWDQALDAMPRFQTSDNPRLPFKVLDLYAQADALEAQVVEVCAE
ncbi:hypothetical protein PXK30_20800 [Phaeobacter gallaeciensis]|jgi:hypothetical protein|uniref:hypothetical protein n=1 Tax=Roseobacteraceae TaxID=2854170 RepID=UPI00105CCCD9|nr:MULTISPECIES: hypothetical protein [Roseobacteraceae]MDE4306061.1 hypothetical protein [Phaeobacter gallaeciensis]MDE4310436.1 hypothetical protein [Phaeobacter gallaeciensis]MDE4314871.1 hypothetical protein [Phaeobacter gallaeciensis]MDE4319339.1 hypothetical protein [Phaeobacter gallaeciensis]MDE4323719.1 hypothetical protein [Phaeobacter gallaeciensis]